MSYNPSNTSNGSLILSPSNTPLSKLSARKLKQSMENNTASTLKDQSEPYSMPLSPVNFPVLNTNNGNNDKPKDVTSAQLNYSIPNNNSAEVDILLQEKRYWLMRTELDNQKLMKVLEVTDHPLISTHIINLINLPGFENNERKLHESNR